MLIKCQLIDLDSGEVLGTSRAHNYVTKFSKTDAGFKFILSWIESAVRGIRLINTDGSQMHRSIQVRVDLSEDLVSNQTVFEFLPFDDSKLAVPAVF